MSTSYPPQPFPNAPAPYGLPPQPMPPAFPGAGGPSGAGAGLEMGDFIRILKQRKAVIIITTMLLSIIAVSTTVALYIFYPGFRAEAILDVIPPRTQAFVMNEGLVEPRQMELLAQTEAQRVKQKSLLAEVLELPEIKATEFYKSYGSNFEECLEDLHSKVSSNVIRDTTYIRVSFMTWKRKEAVAIVNAVVSRFLAKTGSMSRTEATERIENMQTLKTQVSQELENKRNEIRNFRQQSEAIESERTTLASVLAELKSRLANIQEERPASIRSTKRSRNTNPTSCRSHLRWKSRSTRIPSCVSAANRWNHSN